MKNLVDFFKSDFITLFKTTKGIIDFLKNFDLKDIKEMLNIADPKF